MVTPINVRLYKYATTGWKDRLVSYDGYGITYDTQGNPLIYRGHTLEWSRIRLLTKWDDTEMEYDASGIRTRKGNTTYELDGSSIISETTNGNTIRYYYGNGGIVGFRYNGSRYYYEKNLQGDITAIYDVNGNLVGSYAYDAWGNCTITTDIGGIATVNPFRYRCYYYDSDIGLYYLKGRYYDPATCRFINADSVNYLGANEDICAFNLFAYCSDNPVVRVDPEGASVGVAILGFSLWKIGVALVGTIATFMVVDAIAKNPPKLPSVSLPKVDSKPKIDIALIVDEREVEKEDEASKNEKKHEYQYWLAGIVNKQIIPIKGVSYSAARVAVLAGENILCIDHGAAYALVKFFPGRIQEPKHRCEDGYLNHYHLNSAHGNHVWYYGE